MSKPEGAPVYYGFPIVDGLEVEGFRLGMITDFEASPESGDAFIVAPDDSRAGLVWDLTGNEEIEVVMEADEGRWGVYGVRLSHRMATSAGRRANLEDLVRLLKPKWEEWRGGAR